MHVHVHTYVQYVDKFDCLLLHSELVETAERVLCSSMIQIEGLFKKAYQVIIIQYMYIMHTTLYTFTSLNTCTCTLLCVYF